MVEQLGDDKGHLLRHNIPSVVQDISMHGPCCPGHKKDIPSFWRDPNGENGRQRGRGEGERFYGLQCFLPILQVLVGDPFQCYSARHLTACNEFTDLVRDYVVLRGRHGRADTAEGADEGLTALTLGRPDDALALTSMSPRPVDLPNDTVPPQLPPAAVIAYELGVPIITHSAQRECLLNGFYIGTLPGAKDDFRAQVVGNIDRKRFAVDLLITLAEGALVRFAQSVEGAYQGDFGTVVSLDATACTVQVLVQQSHGGPVDPPRHVRVGRERFSPLHDMEDIEEGMECENYIEQIPLAVAHAVSFMR